MISIAVAVAGWNVGASALVNLAGTIADAASIEFADAIVHIIADAIGIFVRCAIATARAEGVELVALAVTVASWDVGASALVDLARTVAHSASIECTNAVVFVITDAISIFVRSTITTASAEGVELVAIAITVACRNVGASALVDLAGTIAHAASIECSNAVILVVTNPVGIGVGSTITTADIEGI